MDSGLLGIAFSLLAALGFGLSAVLARPGLAHIGVYRGTLISVVGSLVFIGLIALLADFRGLLRVSLVALGWFALIGLLNFALGRLFYNLGIQRIGVARSSPLVGTTPLLAGALAVLFLGERLSLLLGVGAVMVVAGVVLIMREGR